MWVDVGVRLGPKESDSDSDSVVDEEVDKDAAAAPPCPDSSGLSCHSHYTSFVCLLNFHRARSS